MSEHYQSYTTERGKEQKFIFEEIMDREIYFS